jgi:ribosomal protein L37AE/L43A
MNRYGPRYYTERAETYAPAQPMADIVTRPDMCPSCHCRVVDTLAKVITPTTTWRCRGCEHVWSLATPRAASGHHR